MLAALLACVSWGCAGQPTPAADAGDADAPLPPDARPTPDARPPDAMPDAGPFCGDQECSGGENSNTCCVDCGCPDGYGCQGGACVDLAVCGDNRCAASEAQTCCKDCGCPSGRICRDTGGCEQVGTSTLRWTVKNSCMNGENVQIRFWDITDRLVWPTATTVYVQMPGTSVQYPMSCTTGAKVCFGANQAMHNHYWGIDIDWSKACDDCCYTCSTRDVTGYDLTCP